MGDIGDVERRAFNYLLETRSRELHRTRLVLSATWAFMLLVICGYVYCSMS